MSLRTVHVFITGRVQGVYYRAWAREQSTSLGLDGWVRNRRDGSVEAVFSGAADQVQFMLDACADGPPDARVTDVRIVQDGGGVGPGFAILPTK